MPARYAPLPTHRPDHDSDNELEAAFEDSDDEEDLNVPESHPLTQAHTPIHPPSAPIPGAYDFERVDYDVPPPGSPTRAMDGNNWGNSNGLVPSFTDVDISRSDTRQGGWFGRAVASLLPSHYINRLSLSRRLPVGFGGGLSNDGVFANMMAKPERPRLMRQGDDSIYLAPEVVQNEAPPSYSSAQADAVPSYWETTVHLSSTSPNPTAGEMIIEGLPTGTLFSFLWNMLVSISFQFVGFLLTFLLHTTHSAKLGSRAGLGVTLIQFGFAMRNQAGDGSNDSWNSWRGGGEPAATAPSFPTPADAANYYSNSSHTSEGIPTPDDTMNSTFPDSTTEWLSFLLMTVGWFMLLTSLLSFWRVKRWERSILSSSMEPTAEVQAHQAALITRLQNALGIRRGLSEGGTLLRQGLSFSEDSERPLPQSDDGRLAAAIAEDVRLQNDLRSAGLL